MMIFKIIKDILNDLCDYLNVYGIWGLIVGLIFLIIGSYIRDNRKNPIILVGFFLSGIYIYMLFVITLFSRSANYNSCINLIPFSTFKNTGYPQKIITENIFLLFPMPILLNFLNPQIKKMKIMGVCLCLCITIEMLQQVFSLGHFEIDDIILNMLGSGISTILYFIMSSLYNK